MALNFPLTPTIGQLYPSPPIAGQPVYQWDGEKWTVLTGGTSPVYIGDVPPSNPPNGALWWNSSNGQLYINYMDGNSSQWVMIISALSTQPRSPARYITGNDTLTSADHGKTIIFNSAAPITVVPDPVANLGDGWWCDIYNFAAGKVTIDPTGSELVDGSTVATVYREERMRLYNAGTGFITFDHAGEWVQYTPVLTASGGGAPTAAAVIGRYKKIRTKIDIQVFVNQLGGTGVNFLLASLPIVASSVSSAGVVGHENAITGKGVCGAIPQNSANLFTRFADANPTATIMGAAYYLSAVYEVDKNV